ncbi:Plasmid stabilization system protein [Pelotomaculum schinkii]|uniref:Plasmid stabilization system protein n=1 Tax=Pelotomaculum schinkii TaxID=78350 RepID=A0A4Y7R611_9FIRM|nr:type II toxin-antitoxin system RelE/ParE family toxin [Pelotomaculum schinkii]TEB04385.1 Plasmid stabilization system protein [Pelotomaculum schinkii]
MTEYKVVIEFPAQRDLQGILRYITATLKEPVIARRIYISIKEQILTLSQMPLRHSVVQDQQYAAIGVRKLLVENYIAFYIVNEAKCEVHVLRILYNRREWQNIL